jgi:hypothetical protein
LVGWGRQQAGVLARHAWRWLLPWTLFLATYLLAVLWHQKAFGLVSIQVSRLIMGALVYAAARLIGLRWAQLRWGVGLACGAYAILAGWEWWSAFNPSSAATFQDAFTQHLTGFRVGLRANSIALGNQLIWLMGIVVLSQLLTTKEAQRGLVPAVLAATCALFACLLTFSRGPLLALPLLLIMAMAFAPKRLRFRILVATFVVFTLTAVAMVVLAPENRLLNAWNLALDGARHWPLMGPGTAGPGELFIVLNGPVQPMPKFTEHSHFHSDWLQPIMMGGVVLAIGQLATMAWLLRRLWGNPVLIWIVLAPLAFGLTDRVIHENNSFGFFVAILALYSAAFDNETADHASS